MIAEHRLRALQTRLAGEGAPAILVTAPANLRYLTGFEGVIDDGINAACLVTEGSARFYTDHRYTEAAGAAAEGTPWELRAQREDLYAEICEDLVSEGVGSLLVESAMPHGRFVFLAEKLTGAVRTVEGFVESQRQVKEVAEVERIARAAALADRAFEYIITVMAPGMSEAEVALELEFYMRRNGSEGMPFSPIVASGPNGARPHAIPGSRRLERGDLVVLDFGARIGDYCSDMTRTVAIGAASDEQRLLHDAVLEANGAGLAAVRTDVPCPEVDAAARTVLEARGLGREFTHGLGHGVGLDVHELPTLGPRSTHTLRAGMVVTIEPGVYVAGLAGVRIEDLVVVEDAGHRRLTTAPKELIEI